MDIDAIAIKSAMAEIVKLNPKPGIFNRVFKIENNIIPDFIISENEGELSLDLTKEMQLL